MEWLVAKSCVRFRSSICEYDKNIIFRQKQLAMAFRKSCKWCSALSYFSSSYTFLLEFFSIMCVCIKCICSAWCWNFFILLLFFAESFVVFAPVLFLCVIFFSSSFYVCVCVYAFFFLRVPYILFQGWTRWLPISKEFFFVFFITFSCFTFQFVLNA